MSTKSRKAIPLKDDIVQPTSFDLEKLYETLETLFKQVESVRAETEEKAADLEYRLEIMTKVSENLQNCIYTLSDLDD